MRYKVLSPCFVNVMVNLYRSYFVTSASSLGLGVGGGCFFFFFFLNNANLIIYLFPEA